MYYVILLFNVITKFNNTKFVKIYQVETFSFVCVWFWLRVEGKVYANS